MVSSADIEFSNKEHLKEAERASIKELVATKKGTLGTTKTKNTTQLGEIADGVYDHTQNIIPNSLEYALEGAAADGADKFLKDIKKPDFDSPVKTTGQVKK